MNYPKDFKRDWKRSSIGFGRVLVWCLLGCLVLSLLYLSFIRAPVCLTWPLVVVLPYGFYLTLKNAWKDRKNNEPWSVPSIPLRWLQIMLHLPAEADGGGCIWLAIVLVLTAVGLILTVFVACSTPVYWK